MRRPCLRCGADLPPPDPGWGGRPRQYCGAGCRKAGQRLRAALGDDWWQQQPWYPAWAAAEERERQERKDRADAEQRERDRQAEAARQQAEEKRRQADEDRKLLESMPPQVRAGVEAARRAEGERARRQLALMTLRMELELLSETYATVLAGTGQRVQLTGQASRTEKLLWAAALAPDDAEAQALFGKARELAAKDAAPTGRPRTPHPLRTFFPPSPPGQLRCLVRHRRAGRPGRHRGWAVQQERERAPLLSGERGCRIDQFPDPGIRAAARFVCGALVMVVPVAGLRPGGRGRAWACGPGTGARSACRPGSGFPLRC
jgi:hypothetical protein